MSTAWCLLLVVTVGVLTDLSCGLRNTKHHDSPFDSEWSSLDSLDDVASWFHPVRDNNLEDPTTTTTSRPVAIGNEAADRSRLEKPMTLSGIVRLSAGQRKETAGNDPCATVLCRAGRVCRSSENPSRPARCVCGGPDHCLEQQHPVCGTDGSWYPSHCELHRIACITGVHISADRTGTNCAADIVEEKIHRDPSTTVATPTSSAAPSRDCSESRFERMKTSLLSYHCARDTTAYDCSATTDNNQMIVADMFEYYDWSGDDRLELNELLSVEQRDHLDRLSQHCRLEDLLVYSDQDGDGFISLTEFYTTFGILAAVDDVRSPEVFRTSVSFGNSVELKCDSASGDGESIIWKRNGNDLNDLEDHHIKVFSDGSLYIGQLTLHHIGNYTCQLSSSGSIIQTHVLLVQMAPRVLVSPRVQYHLAGSTAALKCRSSGLPAPAVTWQANDRPLFIDDQSRQRFHLLRNNASLEVKSWTDEPTSSVSYQCIAKNMAGTSQDIGTVVFDNIDGYMAYEHKPSELVAVFHEHGYTVYEMNRCHIAHEVIAEFQLPAAGAGGQLCPLSNCTWSDAVNVRGLFVYVAQPTLNRVVIIEVTDRLNPIEVVMTVERPVSLLYVQHLDQVWVLGQSGDDDDAMVAMVIREASEPVSHHTVHVHPTSDERFDQISHLFLPSSNDLEYSTNTGYAARTGKMVLEKIDLDSLMHIGDIDLSGHMCVPVNGVFLPIGGRVVISCASFDEELSGIKKQLVIDYITDKVIQVLDVEGTLFVSPDLRHLVVLNGKTLTVFTVSDDGTMTHSMDERTELQLSHVTFFPSTSGHGYSLLASSDREPTVAQIDINTGRVQLIKVEMAPKLMVSGPGQFAGHVAAVTKDSVIIIDGAQHRVDCQWPGVPSASVVVPLVDLK